ncbi:hypothetical protein A9264_01395 [Vibrio sp. UCD-FRSSP16_10]|uniref:hypothetical protein n=1 Tax=unclassified Vibrio TaxID=2614977 RepID=UPI0007FDC3C5|nr:MULTISPECIES: hypothetical protein [unclassified Vibrio]OBT17443.1 hypothetical protein A9260_02845 [Vibrio sp. UCD-FRSSP16_30]OBT23212.1 hypothetical protein A9264_01395 [Vibrio sp. UCD-FRSSP16_10]
MPYKDSNKENRADTHLVHFSAWVAVVLILIALLLVSLQRVRKEAESTSVSLIAHNALYRANYLRQYWELHGKPVFAEINGLMIEFNDKGWVKPVLKDVKSCKAWQEIILPEPKHEYSPVSMELQQDENQYSCTYTFNNDESLVINMVGGNLSIQKEY